MNLQLIGFVFFIFSVVACRPVGPQDSENRKDSGPKVGKIVPAPNRSQGSGSSQGPTTPSKPNSSCVTYLVHQDPRITRAFEESFLRFGILLLKYQEILNSNKDPTEEFSKIDLVNIEKDGKYLDIKVDAQGPEAINSIEQQITAPQVQAIWQSWCAHPDNFLSWLLHPILWREANTIEELSAKTNGFGYGTRDTIISWFDDGFWMMTRLIGLKVKNSPQESSTWVATPEKWLIKLDGDRAITR